LASAFCHFLSENFIKKISFFFSFPILSLKSGAFHAIYGTAEQDG